MANQTQRHLQHAQQKGIAILDYGSQYTQLIARRIREQGVYATLYPWNTAPEQIFSLAPRGIILSGGPSSVYAPDAPYLLDWVLESDLPVLGICYGMQLLAHTLHGAVSPAEKHEYGHAHFQRHTVNTPLFADWPETADVWMSHADHIERPPEGFISLGHSLNSPFAAIGQLEKHWYGVQFHPEVRHTPLGDSMLRRFALDICGCASNWSTETFIEETVADLRETVGKSGVVMGLSGGVDSMVAATLIDRAIGKQLHCIFVNNGLMRQNESEQVVSSYKKATGRDLIAVDATEDFLDALAGVTEPETKRKVIGRLFVEVFQNEALRLKDVDFLGQGTIYPDVIESAAKERSGARVIKTHHNVGGLPETLHLKLLEPLRYLFKDEVRRVGEELGLPEELVWRQPFPGPGLAIRCLGEVTFERLERLRRADFIFRQELERHGLLREIAQAYAGLLPVKSVGVMGDNRTYAESIVLRAVITDDFMTADWARLSYDLLALVSRRIVNEVEGINRVVYDITSKPPATIEWE